MKFYEWQGVILNLDAVKVVQKAIDKSKIKKQQNEDTGDVEEVIDGKPFLITFDMGDGTAINFTYATRDERDANFNMLLDVFQVRQQN